MLGKLRGIFTSASDSETIGDIDVAARRSVIALGVVVFVLAVANLLVWPDFERFLRHLAIVGILAAARFFMLWVKYDARTELKSLQIQNRETKGTPTPGARADIEPKEPWLFP